MAHTNKSMADRIGVTHSTVSRICDGLRQPSVDVMTRIQEEFGWTIGDQVAARQKGNYPAEFRRKCMEAPSKDVAADSPADAKRPKRRKKALSGRR